MTERESREERERDPSADVPNGHTRSFKVLQ